MKKIAIALGIFLAIATTSYGVTRYNAYDVVLNTTTFTRIPSNTTDVQKLGAYVDSFNPVTTWGSISGTLTNQTDLSNALNSKANASEYYNSTVSDGRYIQVEVDGSTTNELPVAGNDIDVTGQTVSIESSLDYIDTINDIDSMSFYNDLSSNPAYEEGRLFYDKNKKSVAYYNDNSEVTVNIAQENLVYVYNNTGSDIANGKAVYIAGALADAKTVMLASASSYNTSRIVGITTSAIPNGGFGYVTPFGDVGGLNTLGLTAGDLIYLSTTSGEWTTTRPADENFIVTIGRVSIVSATEGVIFVFPSIPETAAEVHTSIRGWADSNQLSYSFVDGTRTLSITPASGSYYRWYDSGEQFRKASDSIQIADIEGAHYIYYDHDTLVDGYGLTTDQIRTILGTKSIAAYIYWDATNKTAIYINREQHTIGMSGSVQRYLHLTRGAQFISGLAPNTISADGSGDVASSAQFGIDAGTIVDEDIFHTPEAVVATTGIPIFYLSGSSTTPSNRRLVNAGYPVSTTGTGRLAYNTISGGNWIISEAINNSFVLCHVLASGEVTASKRVLAIMGQANYATLSDARTAASIEMANLQTYGMISPELVPVATFIYETSSSYTNAVKARVRTISTGVNYIDWRYTKLTGIAGGTGATATSFVDDSFNIYNTSDTTKKIKFSASGITTGTTRTLTSPNADGTIALTSDLTPLAPKASPSLTGTTSLVSNAYSSTLLSSEAEGLGGADLRIGLDETNRTLVIADRGDTGVDFTLTAASNPAIFLSNAAATGHGVTLSTGGFSVYHGGAGSYPFIIRGDITTSGASAFKFMANANTTEVTSSNAQQSWVKIEAAVKQTGTASFDALHVDIVDSESYGDGTSGVGNNLIRADTAGVNKFKVDTAGNGYYAGNLSVTSKTSTNELRVGTSTTNGYVLTADSGGNATWQPAGAASMIYPSSGIAVSTGSAWGTSLQTGNISAGGTGLEVTGGTNAIIGSGVTVAPATGYAIPTSTQMTAYSNGTIGITIDGGQLAITTGSKGYIYIPYACTINSVTMVANETGSVVVDIKKSTFAGFPTTSSITASAKPTITSAQSSTDSTLTGWTTSVSAGDVLEFYVDSVSTIKRVTLVLKVTK